MRHSNRIDRTFRYFRACDTSLRRTFARVRKQQAEAEQANVVQIKRKEKAK